MWKPWKQLQAFFYWAPKSLQAPGDGEHALGDSEGQGSLVLSCLWGFPHSSIGKESACNAGDCSLIPGLGRSSDEGIGYPLQYSWASLVAQLVKLIRLQCGRPEFDPWVGKIPWRGEMLPTQVFWPGEFHGLLSMGSQGVGHD